MRYELCPSALLSSVTTFLRLHHNTRLCRLNARRLHFQPSPHAFIVGCVILLGTKGGNICHRTWCATVSGSHTNHSPKCFFMHLFFPFMFRDILCAVPIMCFAASSVLVHANYSVKWLYMCIPTLYNRTSCLVIFNFQRSPVPLLVC
jgi:hypothetical protein